MHGASDHRAQSGNAQTRRRILLVEDARTHSSFRERLPTFGYVVFASTNGHDTLHFLECLRIDGIVLDLDTRTLDANLLLKEIRKHYAQMPVIVIVSKDDLAGLLRAMRYGATDYLLKPVDDELLRHKCLRLFEGPTAMTALPATPDGR